MLASNPRFSSPEGAPFCLNTKPKGRAADADDLIFSQKKGEIEILKRNQRKNQNQKSFLFRKGLLFFVV